MISTGGRWDATGTLSGHPAGSWAIPAPALAHTALAKYQLSMADRRKRSPKLGSLALGLLALALAGAERPAAAALRVVSMNPSLTRMLIALDAGATLVGVDEFSARTEASVEHLPRVGGLFNPSLEAVVALQPDLVVVVPSIAQRDFRDRLRELGIDVLELSNITLEEVLDSVRELGARVDRVEAAQTRVDEIRRAWSETAARAAKGTSRTAILVLQRDPLYVAGAGSFLDEMLRAAGVENAAARFSDPYPRVGIEWLIAAAPEIIIDSAKDPMPAVEHWSRWPSIPAVAESRVLAVPADNLTLPGPYLDRALRILFEAINALDAPEIIRDSVATEPEAPR
jgi:iron complex transport system substrate-binding protein